MEAFRAVATLDAVQPPYNLFKREIEANVLPYAKNTGLAVLSYGALCRGLLSGKMTTETNFEGDDLRQVDPKFQGERYRHSGPGLPPATLDRLFEAFYTTKSGGLGIGCHLWLETHFT